MTDMSNVPDHADRFVSKLSDLTISDKDGNLRWKQGVRYVDGRPFTGTLDGQRFKEGFPRTADPHEMTPM
jgi:hypothetical protein